MKTLLCLCAALLILVVNSQAKKDALPKAPLGAPLKVSVPLKYLDAAEAYQKLKESFPKIAEMVQDIQIGPNALTLNSGHAQYAELRKKLAEMDVRPNVMLLRAVISEVQADGTEKEISQRKVTFIEGRPWSSYEMIGDKKFKLSMTVTTFKHTPAEKAAK